MTTRQFLNSVNETCHRLSIGRTTLYGLIANGRIKPVKIGARTLIPDDELNKLIDELKTDGEAA